MFTYTDNIQLLPLLSHATENEMKYSCTYLWELRRNVDDTTTRLKLVEYNIHFRVKKYIFSFENIWMFNVD